MIGAGAVCVAILRVKNNTNLVIDEIGFTYDSKEINIRIRNLKPGNSKQTGISTINDVRELIMNVNNLEESYLIKEEIPRLYYKKIIITINDVNNHVCEFDIEEVE